MPMLRIKGIEEDKVKSVSTSLIDELHQIIQCPRDYFTIELVNNRYIMDGKVVPAQKIIEVAWFNRGQDIQDEVALAITKYFQDINECLEIYFISLEPNNYYESGKHL